MGEISVASAILGKVSEMSAPLHTLRAVPGRKLTLPEERSAAGRP